MYRWGTVTARMTETRGPRLWLGGSQRARCAVSSGGEPPAGPGPGPVLAPARARDQALRRHVGSSRRNRSSQKARLNCPGTACSRSRRQLFPAQRHQSPSPHAARVAGYRERRQDGAVTAGHLVVFGSTGSHGLAKPGTTWWNTFSAYRGWESAWGLGNVTGSW